MQEISIHTFLTEGDETRILTATRAYAISIHTFLTEGDGAMGAY